MADQEPGPQASEQTADKDGVFFISLSYKGTSYGVPVQAEDSVASIFDFVQEALDFPRENCKLISRGKMIRPDSPLVVAEAGLVAGSKVLLVATSADDVSFVQKSRPDPLVKGFAEEERDDRNRRKRARAAGASAWGTKQDAEYKFASIKAEFKYSEPPPYEAEKLLQKLATDPGIIDIMKSRQFKVGILTEMSPVEAQERMAKRGTPNMDLLGYNQNAGDMIVLRLRTDNLKGFRPYHDLINTLIHEITHNVWGPHDHNFWKLYGELKAQYMRFHRFWSHGGRSADGGGSQFAGFDSDGEEASGASFGRVLGGASGSDAWPNDDLQRRAAAAAAAEARAVATAPSPAPFVPNFLASNGQWLFLCPCGQVHDPASCTQGGAAAVQDAPSAASAADAAPSGEEEPADVSMTNGEDPGKAADAPTTAEATAADASAGEPVAGNATGDEPVVGEAMGGKPAPDEPTGIICLGAEPANVPMALDFEGPTAGASSSSGSARGLGQAEGPAPDCVEVEGLADRGAASPSSRGDGAPTEPSGGTAAPAGAATHAGTAQVGAEVQGPAVVVDADVPLDMAELADQGLDGASLWLERFSRELRALCARPQQSAAREAIELLLKLVRNIVERPGDPKYRRIRADNPRIRASLLGAGAEVEALMSLLGFQVAVEDGERVFVLRDAAFDCARLLMGRDLLESELGQAVVRAR